MSQSGRASLDDVINLMIQITDAYRLSLKETGWGYRGDLK